LRCESLDGKRRGSDNATGDIPFIAPMRIKYLKSIFASGRRRSGVALLFLVCFSLFALTSSFAQLKTQRRVTGLQPGAAAEGSRVTLLADAPLNDYEGFRRGDRFYVKIPRSELMTALPHFRADGFESVQVQKGGENLIVSFKLQPGATARINQNGNRLDVVFSAPNRSSSNTTASSGTPGTTGRQTSSDRGSDAAGPMPPGGSLALGERIVSGSSGSIDRGGSTFNSRFGNARRPNATTSPNAAVAVASPIPSPSTTLSPTPYSNYPPLTTATPASSSQIAVASRSGRTAITRWMSANRLATLLGALILLSFILYLANAVRRGKKNAVQAAGQKAKVQPKYSPSDVLDELPRTRTNEPLPHQQSVAEQPAASAFAAAASAHNEPWVLTMPTIVSPTASPDDLDEYSTDQEEREVFEL
jgi:hypothetical protein